MGQANTTMKGKGGAEAAAASSKPAAGAQAAASPVDAKALPQKPLKKILMLGNSQSKKSQHVLALANQQHYGRNYLTTIGFDFKTTEHNGQRFQIWDTAGQERFKTLTTAYTRGADCFLLCPTSVEEFGALVRQAMPTLSGGVNPADSNADVSLPADLKQFIDQTKRARMMEEALALVNLNQDHAAAAATPVPVAPVLRCMSAFVIVDPEFFPTPEERNAIMHAAECRGLLTIEAPTAQNRVEILETIANDLQLTETQRLEAQLQRILGNPARNFSIDAALKDPLAVPTLRDLVKAYA